MRRDFKGFMKTFFSVFPRYKQFDIYIAGESFAGTMIPYYAMDLDFSLTGLILFTPWFDSTNQYFTAKKIGLRYNLITDVVSTLLPTSHELCMLTPTFGFPQKAVEEQESKCHARLAKDGNKASFDECEKIYHIIREQSKAGGKQCINVYDVTSRDRTPADGCGVHWPFELGPLKDTLARNDMREALHVQDQPLWVECKRSKLDQSKIDAGIVHLPKLLEKMPILVVGGDHDFVCNVDGIEKSLHELTWEGHRGFGVSLN